MVVLKSPSDHTPVLLWSDVEFQPFKASGPGGQHRNKTETAVRLTHRPTGIVVEASDSKSQGQNRQEAMRRLEKRLGEAQDASERQARQDTRQAQVAAVDRSAKSFTWSWLRGEVINHETGKRVNLKGALAGKLGDLG